MSNDRPGGPRPIQVVRVYESGEWSYEHRPSVPFLGIFLLALGVILLAGQVAPGATDVVMSGIGVAIGLAFLASWARGGWGLYPGIVLVALTLPSLLISLGLIVERQGYGTFLLGAGLLAVAAFRVRDRRGIGWQGFVGIILALFGAVAIAGYPGAGDVVWAAILIAVGANLLLRRR